ncbi:MAG TPA: hypothetical protein VGJ03_06360 [Acidimicrobiales bacterium]|jgi:hypothetical protein
MEVFDDTFVPPELHTVWAGSHRCPRCFWPRLRPVASVDQEHWLCESCEHCWRVEHGRLRPVDPITCHGCTARSKSDCIALMQRTFPRFGAGAGSDDGAISI